VADPGFHGGGYGPSLPLSSPSYITHKNPAVADPGGGWGMHPPTGGPAYRDFCG